MAYYPLGIDYEQLQNAFPGLAPNAMEAATQAYQAWFKVVFTLNRETASFMSQRLQQDAEFTADLMQCRSPQDLAQLQLNFCRKTVADYTRQTQKMGSLVTESFRAIDRPETLTQPEPETLRLSFPNKRRAA